MKNLKTMIDQPLTWSFNKRKISLHSRDQIIIEMVEEKGTKASFILDGKDYKIRNIGFWNLKTIIEKEGNQIMILKRHFLGSKATVEFAGGNHYICKVKNAPLVKLIFFDSNEDEVLYYRLDATLHPKTEMKILKNNLPEFELLMLIILGCYSFKGIVIENDTSNLIVMAGA